MEIFEIIKGQLNGDVPGDTFDNIIFCLSLSAANLFLFPLIYFFFLTVETGCHNNHVTYVSGIFEVLYRGAYARALDV